MHGVDGRKQGFCPLQPPTKSMVDSKAVSNPPVVLGLGTLLLDFVEPCPPLRIGMLRRVSLSTLKEALGEDTP